MWQFPHFTPNHAPDWDTLIARFNWLADMAAVPFGILRHGSHVGQPVEAGDAGVPVGGGVGGEMGELPHGGGLIRGKRGDRQP